MLHITQLFKCEPNNVYQRVSRAQRDFNKFGKRIPADILLEAQLRDTDFQAHHYAPELFRPTPSQQRLANALYSVNDMEGLRLAVLVYLVTTAPNAIK